MERRGFFAKLFGGLLAGLGLASRPSWAYDVLYGASNINPSHAFRVLPSNEETIKTLGQIKESVDNDMEGYLSMIGLQATPTNYGWREPDGWQSPDLVEVFRTMEKDHMADAMETVGRQVKYLLEAIRQKDALDAAMVALR